MKFQWIYDKSLNLLMITPHFSGWSLPSQQMWRRMLYSLNLNHWLAYYEGKPSELIINSFVYDLSTLAELRLHLQPHTIWVFGVECENVLSSPHPDKLCQWPLLKKDVWKKWLTILPQ